MLNTRRFQSCKKIELHNNTSIGDFGTQLAAQTNNLNQLRCPYCNALLAIQYDRGLLNCDNREAKCRWNLAFYTDTNQLYAVGVNGHWIYAASVANKKFTHLTQWLNYANTQYLMWAERIKVQQQATKVAFRLATTREVIAV